MHYYTYESIFTQINIYIFSTYIPCHYKSSYPSSFSMEQRVSFNTADFLDRGSKSTDSARFFLQQSFRKKETHA